MRRRRRGTISGGVWRAGWGVASSVDMEVAVVERLVCESCGVLVVVERVDSVCVREAEAVVVFWESEGARADVEDTTLRLDSSERMFMMGTSSAGLMKRASIDGGSPFAHMRSAFWTSTPINFSCDRRYIVSSPAVTVSHTAAMRFSSLPFKLGCCASRAFHCRDVDERASRWSSKARKCCFSFAGFGASTGRSRKRVSRGVARKRSALLVRYPLLMLSLSFSSFAGVSSSSFLDWISSEGVFGAINQLLQSFLGAAMRVNS